jgi:serine protease Do
MRMVFLFIALWMMSSGAALSQQVRLSSGTGFFVSRQGEIITNAHVVSPCMNKEEVYFTSDSVSRPVQARVVGLDAHKDLALLETGYRPERVANLRWMHTRIAEQAKVFLLGYPEADSINSPYVTKYATIKALEGPLGEQGWLQFTDAARQGNSGGPLLDVAGNVVGVVTAKSKVMRLNQLSAQNEVVSESDIAITAAVLKRFLDTYQVYYNQGDAVIELGERRLETIASGFVVHIFCEAQG